MKQQNENSLADSRPDHLVGSAVKLNFCPRWFTEKLRAAGDRKTLPIWADQKRIVRYSASWLDHIGLAVVDGDECFVSEPYLDALQHTAEDAVDFAELIGAAIEFSPCSNWNPGRTGRIIFRASPRPLPVLGDAMRRMYRAYDRLTRDRSPGCREDYNRACQVVRLIDSGAARFMSVADATYRQTVDELVVMHSFEKGQK